MGDGITVSARFQNLNEALDDEDIEIDCGNGDNTTASECNGTTGSCSSICPYPSSGTYTLRTSIGNLTCETATVRVAGDYNSCGITPSQKIVLKDNAATITLDYNNVNMNNLIFGGVYSNYSYGQRVLAAQENLAIYVSGTATSTVNPLLLQADAVELEKITSGEIPSTGKATIAITLRNNDDYATQITGVFLSRLPSGVTALQVSPMTIRGNERKTIYVQVQASKAKTGSYKSTVEVTHSGGKVSKDFSYDIVPESGTVKVSARLKESTYSQKDGKGIATFVFAVRNEEDDNIKISAVVTGIPASWTQGTEPSLNIIRSGEERTFIITLNADEYESKAYPAILEIRNTDERRATVPFVIEMDKAGASPFVGFFTLGSSNNVLFIIAVLLVLGIGYLVYRPVAKVRGNANEYRNYLKEAEEKGGTDEYGVEEKTVIGNENVEGPSQPAEATSSIPFELLPEKREEAPKPAVAETTKYWEIFEEIPEKKEILPQPAEATAFRPLQKTPALIAMLRNEPEIKREITIAYTMMFGHDDMMVRKDKLLENENRKAIHGELEKTTIGEHERKKLEERRDVIENEIACHYIDMQNRILEAAKQNKVAEALTQRYSRYFEEVSSEDEKKEEELNAMALAETRKKNKAKAAARREKLKKERKAVKAKAKRKAKAARKAKLAAKAKAKEARKAKAVAKRDSNHLRKVRVMIRRGAFKTAKKEAKKIRSRKIKKKAFKAITLAEATRKKAKAAITREKQRKERKAAKAKAKKEAKAVIEAKKAKAAAKRDANHLGNIRVMIQQGAFKTAKKEVAKINSNAMKKKAFNAIALAEARKKKKAKAALTREKLRKERKADKAKAKKTETKAKLAGEEKAKEGRKAKVAAERKEKEKAVTKAKLAAEERMKEAEREKQIAEETAKIKKENEKPPVL